MRGPLRLSIRAGLIVGVLSIVVVTAALVHVPWSVTARASVIGLALRLNDQSIDDVRGKMSALLDQVISTQATIAANIAAGSVDFENAARRDAFLLSFIEQHPTISAIELGRLDDWSFAVRRLAGGTFAAEETQPSADAGPAQRRTTLYKPSVGGGPVSGSLVASRIDYLVSSQFWFKQAFEQSGSSWSDIYPIADDGTLGFAAVQTVTAPDGQAGVISVSMELDRVSAFLGSVELGRRGAVFLTNPYGELVASANAAPTTEPPARNPPAGLKLGDASAPLLRVAAVALDATGVRLGELRDRHQIAYRDEASGETYFITFSPLTQMGLIVGLVVPESEILGDIDRNTAQLAYLLLGFICITAAMVAVLASWTLGRPLAAVTRNAILLGDFRFDEIKPVASRLTEIGALSQAVVQMNASLASFKKYVPTEIVRMLFAQGVEAELGGTRRELSIFFMDLAHFTRISEALGDELIPFIGEFLSEMSDEIRAAGGTIDKYIGDAVMAFWGAPAPNEDHAITSCRAALACQARLRALRARSTGPAGLEMRARIGINTGCVLVGNVGSRDRLNYTAIGDPVNVASRLEALNKRYGSEILIGEETYRAAKDHIVARRLERVAVYGKAEGIEVYELLALAEEAPPDLLAWLRTYERGMDALRRQAWDEADSLFVDALEMRGQEDGPSRLMLERTRAFRESPPPEDWDGLLRLSEK